METYHLSKLRSPKFRDECLAQALRSMKTKDQGLEKFDCEPMKHLAPMRPPPFPKVLLMLTVHGLITFPN